MATARMKRDFVSQLTCLFLMKTDKLERNYVKYMKRDEVGYTPCNFYWGAKSASVRKSRKLNK